MRDINTIGTYDEAVVACLTDMEEMGCIAVDTYFKAVDFDIDVDSLIEAFEESDVSATDYINAISH